MPQKIRGTAETLSGLPQPNFGGYTASPIIAKRDPTSADTGYPLGQIWVNKSANTVNILSSVAAGIANYVSVNAGSGSVDSINNLSPSGGNITLAGTANQITATSAGSTVTFSTPAAFTAPGSITSTTTITSGTSLAVGTSATVGTTLGVTGATTLAALTQVGTASINGSGASATTIGTGGTGAVNIGNATGNTAVTGSLTASTTLTATLGAITATNGNLVLGTAGNKIVSSSVGTTTAAGANSFGSVTLVSGTATVATTAVTANSLIITWRQAVGSSTALGQLTVGTITAGTSFVINAATQGTPGTPLATDLSVVGWMIIN